ncbi:MAG: nucleotide sugar dehydrogenase [Planctomycetota bacterium]|jgi:UDP-N-acetyl-D-mannosaminuronic acid dehydrogenase
MNQTAPFVHDVCILGTGRVGLPLGLSLLETGTSVVGVDIDADLRAAVNDGRMPFHEPGYDDLVARKAFIVHESPEVVAQSRALIVTVGTPLHNHIETDLAQVQRVLESIGPHLRPGQLLCLRSTVAPGTTAFVRRWLERNTSYRVGHDLLLAFCPERIAEGKAYEEIHSLPQIVGTEDEASRDAACALFSRLAPEVLPTDYVTAELVKLFNNILRYVHFALANQFALVADTFGANIYETRRLANYKYPRSFLASPGFTAGTCLRKDFGMINEWSPYPDMLLSAWKMNEYAPAFLVDHLMKRAPIHDRRVAVLGFTFKQDTDDIRDSLAPKLWRYIHRQLPLEIRVTDHNLPDPIQEPSIGSLRNWTAAEAIADAECVFVATNHSGYDEVLRDLARRHPDAWVADIWNVGGIDQIFYQARDLTAEGGR